MPYFPVDDQFAFHPKAIAAGNAAVGLWTRAGSWSKAPVSGGFVPVAIVSSIASTKLAQRLVDVGLWEQVEGGYQFHDWTGQAGNLPPDQEKARKEANRKRQERFRNKTRDGDVSNAVTNAVTDALVTAPPSPSPLTTDTYARPVLNREGYPQGTDEGVSESVEALCSRQVGHLGVDYDRARNTIAKAAGRIPSPTDVVRIVATILERASGPVKSPTGFVVTAIRTDWAEWQKFLDEGQVAS